MSVQDENKKNESETEKNKHVDDSPDEQFVDTIADLDNITITDLNLGVLNELPSAEVPDLTLWDPTDQVASTISVIKGQIDSSRQTHKAKNIALVVSNPTPVDDSDPIVGVIRSLCKDSEYRLGKDRAYLYIYCPELHRSMLRPVTLDPEEMSIAEKTSIEQLTKVWGPRETIKNIPVGSFIKIELPDVKDILHAELDMGTGEAAPKRKFVDPQKKKKKPDEAARDPKSKKTKPGSKSKPIKNVLDNKLAEESLALPEPKPRPSSEVLEVYHTSVDKELLKGPYPGGYSDWTGAGGGGTLAMTKGKPKRGRKVYYLKGKEKGPDGKRLLVSLPKEYALHNRSWIKVHRAMLGPLIAMIDQARADGIPDPIFRVFSGWRSVDQQVKGFLKYFPKYGGDTSISRFHPKNEKAYRACRVYNGDPFDPKHRGNIGGDHLAGRGVDLFLGIVQNDWSRAYSKKHKVKRKKANAAFKRFMSDKPTFLWLKQNAEFFGFYNLPSEPWHWAFNPDDRPKRQDAPPEFSSQPKYDDLSEDGPEEQS